MNLFNSTEPPTASEIRQFLHAHAVRYTRQRALILQVLAEKNGPMDAQHIYQDCVARMTDDEAANMGAVTAEPLTLWLSTVYRTLELFADKQLVEKMVRLGDDQATYVLKHRQHQHYAICTRCHAMLDLKSCPEHAWLKELAAQGFEMTGHRIEVYGLCDRCRRQGNTPIEQNHQEEQKKDHEENTGKGNK